MSATNPNDQVKDKQSQSDQVGGNAGKPEVARADKDGLSEYGRVGVIVLEISGPKSESILFPPTQSRLRGRFTMSNHPGQTAAAQITMMGSFIPGMCIKFDGQKKQLVVFDPLGTDEYKDQMDKIKTLHKEAFRTKTRVEETVEYAFKNATDAKTVLWEMRKLVDAGLAKIVKGEGALPPVDAFSRLPGRTRAEPFNNSPRKRKFVEESEDEVAARIGAPMG